jgi:predicted KAP-like P-loop ATPase
LLEDLRKNGKKPIDRIILYVDDLDRCQPEQVVEVLQAVHLLLAFDLFSVVVGVDARWLERSLYRSYVGRAVAGGGVAGSRMGTQAFSPQNYLEKIFQIPYSLQDMSQTGFKQLVGKLVTTRTDYQRKLEAEEQQRKDGKSVLSQ